MKHGSNVTTYTKNYWFTKEQLSILRPMHKTLSRLRLKHAQLKKEKKDTDKLEREIKAVHQGIMAFISKEIMEKYCDPNKKYTSRFSIDRGWIRIRQVVDYAPITKSKYSVQDTMGYGLDLIKKK